MLVYNSFAITFVLIFAFVDVLEYEKLKLFDELTTGLMLVVQFISGYLLAFISIDLCIYICKLLYYFEDDLVIDYGIMCVI